MADEMGSEVALRGMEKDGKLKIEGLELKDMSALPRKDGFN